LDKEKRRGKKADNSPSYNMDVTRSIVDQAAGANMSALGNLTASDAAGEESDLTGNNEGAWGSVSYDQDEIVKSLVNLSTEEYLKVMLGPKQASHFLADSSTALSKYNRCRVSVSAIYHRIIQYYLRQYHIPSQV
jgi:hypothetical protein